jgi:FAD/FMN-containing dehydrogenase
MKWDNEKNQKHESPSQLEKKAVSRRNFLANAIVGAGSLLVASQKDPLAAFAASGSKLNVNHSDLKIKFKFKGEVLTPSDSGFKKAVFGELWNELRPDNRQPNVVVQVTDEADVVAAVKYAKANNLKVCVRGGGHNWCAPSIRNSGMLIDLTNLNKVISIDAKARKAIVQPIISNREMQAYLKPYNLAYPTGHCPPVKLSGYLLSGGMAWNQGVWGPGIGSVEAVELVTPDGELITASATENTDYYWAARGAGPGLFAVVVRYHLKLYPLPQAIAASVYYYPYEKLLEVADWLGPLAEDLSNNVELSLFVLQAPTELVDKCKSSNGKVCMVTATVFADTQEEAKKAVAPLETCPVLDKCLSKTIAEPTDFEKLFDASGALWPANLRCKVDALFSNTSVGDLYERLKDHFLTASSPKTVLMFALFTGKNVPAPLPDAAFSMSAKIYGGPWTMWEKAEDDQVNIAWHEKCVDLIKPLIAGHYVSETDTVGHPDYLPKSYSTRNWQRIEELRKKYDPDNIFFSYSDGLS